MAPTGVYNRMKAYVLRAQEPELPVLSTTTALSLLILYTLIYVIPFYLSSTTRPSPTLSRDAPSVIRGRIRSVTISCILCALSTLIVLLHTDGGLSSSTAQKALHRMGYWPMGLLETVQTLGLTALLFLGPLYEAGVVEGGWKDWIRLRGVDEVIGSWMGYRNLVAGPITEEVLFRSCAVPLLLLSKTSNTTIIFGTPIIFGLAHLHHFYEFRITHPHTPLAAAIFRSIFQLSYTTLFGGYATFVYLRTGSLLAVVLIHAFCNWRGLPRLWGRLEGEERVSAPEVGQSKRSEDRRSSAVTGELGLAWTLVYYVLLVSGAYGFYKYLWSWTESTNALTTF